METASWPVSVEATVVNLERCFSVEYFVQQYLVHFVLEKELGHLDYLVLLVVTGTLEAEGEYRL